MSALVPTQHLGPADVTVGPIEGGWAFWCVTCRSGQAAKTGISAVDEQVANSLASMHEADHSS